MSDPITAQSFMAGSAKTISDDFGNTWPATCAACGQDTMEVVRPGKAQCGACDGNGKPITEGVDGCIVCGGPTDPGWEDCNGCAVGGKPSACQHTPGPWKAVEHNEASRFPTGVMIAVQRADDEWRKQGCICTMTRQGDGRYDPEVTSANARLIARAPEMAAEIASLTATIERLKKIGEGAARENESLIAMAKEVQPDYPWSLGTVREAMWAVTEGYKGVSEACSDLREQLADADRTLAGFVKAVREARECIVAIREMADSIDSMPSTAAFAIRETCDRWLNPPLAAVPAARVVTEGGQ